MKSEINTLSKILTAITLREFPWRNTTNPYDIMVSEIMLQQTQTARVIDKYHQWLDIFPTINDVAKSDTTAILRTWKGLGYNRRGLNLKKSCTKIVEKYNGELPKDKDLLLELPGIGSYTTGAIRVFSWNLPDILLETNIRTVLIHHFYDYQNLMTKVSDGELTVLLQEITNQLQISDWRTFYHQLMDYGVKLKSSVGNLNKKSSTYTKQTKFKGSKRELRANILDYLVNQSVPVEKSIITKHLNCGNHNVEQILIDLVNEGFLKAVYSKHTSSRYTINK